MNFARHIHIPYQAVRRLTVSATVRGADQHILVTSAGKDRLGALKDFTNVIHAKNANIVDTKGTRLGGLFSLTILAKVPGTADRAALDTALKSVSGFETMIMPASQPAYYDPDLETQIQNDADNEFTAYFKVEGADHPGIINKVMKVFEANGLSIDNMSTTSEGAPYGGTDLFMMEGVCNHVGPLSKDWKAMTVLEALREIEASDNVDIEFQEMDDDEWGEGEDEMNEIFGERASERAL